MKTLKKLANNGRGVFEDTCDEYKKTLQDRPYYISELRDAFVDGCNAVTQEQHELALPFAEEYISKKSADVVYVSMDIERAYREGAKKMAEEYQKSRALITARRVRKATRLICAGSQLMSIADNFNKEAEGLVSNEFKQTKISNIYSEMQELFAELSTKFKQWNEECAGIFLNLSSEDCVRWGEEGEKIEYQVRRIMEIDK
jgi:hypothetical protein